MFNTEEPCLEFLSQWKRADEHTHKRYTGWTRWSRDVRRCWVTPVPKEWAKTVQRGFYAWILSLRKSFEYCDPKHAGRQGLRTYH